MKTALAALSLASLLVPAAVIADDVQQKSAPATQEAIAKSTETRLTKGYKPVDKDGKTVYCRKHIPLGTRLPSRTCYSIEQLAELERIREMEKQKLSTKQVQRPADERCNASRCGP